MTMNTSGYATHDPPICPSQSASEISCARPLTVEQKICESRFTVFRWVSSSEALIRCPGEDLHTSQNGERDCKVWLDGAPTIRCFHQHCGEQVKDAASELRREIYKARQSGRATVASEIPKGPLILVPKEAREIEALKEAGQRSKEQILWKFKSTLDELRDASPYRIPDDPVEQFVLQLSTLPQKAIVFNGGLYDSGQPKHAGHFRRVETLIAERRILGEFISQSSFKAGAYARVKQNSGKRLVYTVECDEIDDEVKRKLELKLPLSDEDKRRNKEKSIAIFRWLREAVGLRLLSVVDSTSKSLHGNFAVPPPVCVDQLACLLPAMGCDPKTLNAHQLTRVAGARRRETGQIQSLLFVNPTPNLVP